MTRINVIVSCEMQDTNIVGTCQLTVPDPNTGSHAIIEALPLDAVPEAIREVISQFPAIIESEQKKQEVCRRWAASAHEN